MGPKKGDAIDIISFVTEKHAEELPNMPGGQFTWKQGKLLISQIRSFRATKSWCDGFICVW